jgi:hypothetical protein
MGACGPGRMERPDPDTAGFHLNLLGVADVTFHYESSCGYSHTPGLLPVVRRCRTLMSDRIVIVLRRAPLCIHVLVCVRTVRNTVTQYSPLTPLHRAYRYTLLHCYSKNSK